MATTGRKLNRRRAKEPASDRLEARIRPEQKMFFQRAASLRGVSLKEFMIASMQEAAVKTVEEHELLTLTAQDRRVFVETLMNPAAPNEALRAATERYDRMVTR
jgi:uncharacterized protein (DUF1778 family)